MSEMSFDDEDYGSDEEYASDGGGSDAFEAPPVLVVEAVFHVLTPAECLARAEAQVQEMTELLCCDPMVAQLLLRHFRWNRDKLTDGAHRPPNPPGHVPPFGVCVRMHVCATGDCPSRHPGGARLHALAAPSGLRALTRPTFRRRRAQRT